MPWNPVWFLGQEPRTPRVPYGEDTRIHIYLQNLESSIGQYDNYDKSSWHIYDKNDKAICHFLIRLVFVMCCSIGQSGTSRRTKNGFPPAPRAPLALDKRARGEGRNPARPSSSRINSGSNQRFRDSIANMSVQFLTGRHPKLLARGRLDIFLASLVMRLSPLAVR